MARWDMIYLQKLRKAGIDMSVHNQTAKAAQPNMVYNVQTGKLVKDLSLSANDSAEDRKVKI